MSKSSAVRLTLVAILAVAMTAGAALASGPGRTVRIDTQVKLRDSAPAFHGKVLADNENCVEDRLVKMFRKKRNGKQLLGKTHASDSGRWKVPFDNLSTAAYYAVAPKVEQGTAGTIYVCLRAKSNFVAVD